MTDNILIVAAHPDDEVLGCGGTISRFVREGHNVYIVILGEGITSRYENRNDADPDLVDALQNRCNKVSSFLGAKKLFLYDFPDNRFDTVPLLNIVKKIEPLIEQLHPQVIYTHHSGDLNIDHGITFRAVITASRPIPGSCIREIYTFEIPSATEWSFNAIEGSFEPNVFVDITDTLDTKITAMELYETEIRSFPHPRSTEALKAIAHRWGSVSGVKAAEAFNLIRKIY